MKTKLEFAQKGCERSSLHKLIDHFKPFFKREVLLAGLALGIGVPMLMPKALRAQDATSAATSQQKQAKVQHVSLNEIKKYVADAEKYKIATSEGVTYSAILSDSTEVTIGFHLSSGESATPGEAGDQVFVTIVKGPLKGYDISLSELKAAYKEFSGKELKYVRVGVKISRDAGGEYAEFSIVPVACKDGEIAAGTPIGRVQGSLEGAGSKGCEDTSRVLLSLN